MSLSSFFHDAKHILMIIVYFDNSLLTDSIPDLGLAPLVAGPDLLEVGNDVVSSEKI